MQVNTSSTELTDSSAVTKRDSGSGIDLRCDDGGPQGCPAGGTGFDTFRRNRDLLIRDNYMPASWDAQAARHEAERVLSGVTQIAGTGGRRNVVRDQEVRGDRMCWLRPNEMSDGPLRKAVDALLSLKETLGMWGYDTSGRASVQLSVYPGNGARYVCHTDASQAAPTRTVTAILYLNPEWHLQNGGQLCLYSLSERWTPGKIIDTELIAEPEPALHVHPIANRLVLFDSSIPHEVLPCHAPRYALTVWFHRGRAPNMPLAGSNAVPHPLSLPQIGPRPPTEERIFVSIAAFRDPETRWTVRDLLTKAAHPGRLRICIVWQVDAQTDADILDLPCTPAEKAQIRQIALDYREATGPCKARMLAQKLWAGEEYLLQIDSHMRFAPGWDNALLQWLAECEGHAEHGKAVLTTYPPPYEGSGPDARLPDDDRPTLLRSSHFGPEGMLRLVGSRLAHIPSSPLPSLFWAAGFSFSRSHIIEEVPYEELPYLFFGEEQYMLARMWMQGWDMFTPPRSIAFHLWSRAQRNTSCSCVPQDNHAKQRSQKKVLKLFSNDFSDGSSTMHVASRKLESDSGSIRSLASFQAHCGVQYGAGRLEDTGKRGSAAELGLTFAQLQVYET